MSIIGGLLSGGGVGAVTGAFTGGSSAGFNWGGLASAAGSSGGGWLSALGGLFGGGSGGGSSSLFQGLLGGLGAAAQGYMDEKAVKEAGKQQRQTIGYTAELEDFYKQKDKGRKRAALDTYGQFSLMSRYAPTANRMVPLDQPAKPGLG